MQLGSIWVAINKSPEVEQNSLQRNFHLDPIVWECSVNLNSFITILNLALFATSIILTDEEVEH